MNNHNGKLPNIVEAMLFAAAEPLPAQEMCRVLEPVHAEEIRSTIAALNERYAQSGGAFRIREIAGGFQLYTLPEYADYIEALLTRTRLQRLSAPALETLAVIAYRQPVNTPEIEKIRGVESSGVLRTLLERNLIAIVGRSDGPGRPLLYGTTKEFLYHFGLNDLNELPRMEELEKLLTSREEERQLSIGLAAEETAQESSDAMVAEEVASLTNPLTESDEESAPAAARLVLKRPFPESVENQASPETTEQPPPEKAVEVPAPADESEEDSASELLRTAEEVLTTPIE